jgi:SAM-dependent methyltransferase
VIYESINIPLWHALKPVQGKRILDVGCGSGALGELLQKNGNTVEGITVSHTEAQLAAPRISKVNVLDLNNPASAAAVDGVFDVIVFGDVLEHLLDPLESLATFTKKLAPDGRVCISLPNIACFYVRLGLLVGRFKTSPDGGVLDETHLHYYTLTTARNLLQRAGLKPEKTDYVPAPSVWFYQTFVKKREAGPPAPMAESGMFRFYERCLYPVERFVTLLWPRMLANQFVFVCRKSVD